MAGLVDTIVHEIKVLGVMTLIQLLGWFLLVGVLNVGMELTFILTFCSSMFTAGYMDELNFGPAAATALDYLICWLTNVVVAAVLVTICLLSGGIKLEFKQKPWWSWNSGQVKFEMSLFTINLSGHLLAVLCCCCLIFQCLIRSLVNSISCFYKSFTFALNKIWVAAQGDGDDDDDAE